MLRLGFYLLINFNSHFRLLTSYQLIRIWHTFKLLILFHMHNNLLLNQCRLSALILHFSYLLLSFLLFSHLLVIIELYLFDYNKILPVNIFRVHSTILIKLWIVQCLLLCDLFLLSLIHLPLLTSF